MAEFHTEREIKAMVKVVLNEVGAYWFMPVNTGLGARSVDFLVCCSGVFVAIETKAGGRKPTLAQSRTLSAVRRAGGRTFVTSTPGEVDELRSILWELTRGHADPR